MYRRKLEKCSKDFNLWAARGDLKFKTHLVIKSNILLSIMDNEANKTMEEVQDKEVSKDMAWLTAVCSIITIATIMGNIAVIFTILSKANLRRLRPNLFVLSLSKF